MQPFGHDPRSAPADDVTDAAITAAVELFSHSEKGLAAPLVDAMTHEGIVQLTGSTDNLLARARAAEIARAVRGVRAGAMSCSSERPTWPMPSAAATWLDREQAAFDASDAGACHVDNELMISTASGL